MWQNVTNCWNIHEVVYCIIHLTFLKALRFLECGEKRWITRKNENTETWLPMKLYAFYWQGLRLSYLWFPDSTTFNMQWPADVYRKKREPLLLKIQLLIYILSPACTLSSAKSFPSLMASDPYTHPEGDTVLSPIIDKGLWVLEVFPQATNLPSDQAEFPGVWFPSLYLTSVF